VTKNRLENCSDGVFAIAITLLVLDIKLPEVNTLGLAQALIEALPRIAAYVMSFAIIGLYWISHHRTFELIAKVNGAVFWINLLLLLLVSFIPFPTALLGRYPNEALPIIVYSFTLIACNAVGLSLMAYLLFHPQLLIVKHRKDSLWRQFPLRLIVLVNVGYLLAVLLAGIAPLASYVLLTFILVALIARIVKFELGEGIKP
jgi:uncharacterized membrane protein